ncbi:hypothetical protein M747DRAFT_300048 [Aspergillus niger ATCC 13496]|nr:hypothetical protein M747DRAFT_300048 [Aspergillus niger ATCC 13496]
MIYTFSFVLFLSSWIPYSQGSLVAPSIDTSGQNATSVKAANETASSGLHRQGWTSQPSGRGTLDIIWACCFTMFLCSWSTLCINVPAPGDSSFKIFRRKLYLSALALLGPEFIFQIALSQWESACKSVKDFEASGIKGWTMTHAFYADMGGYVLKPRDWCQFPINAGQLHYLVTKGYISPPSLDVSIIRDRNKVDGMLRIITVWQTLWFIITTAERAAQDLAITTFELTTAGFIVCSFATTICWYHKPADIQVSEVIETDVTIEQILLEAEGHPGRPFSRTPLDFITRKEWAWSLYWSNWTNILRKMRIVIFLSGRPVNRFQNTVVPEPSKLGYAMFLLLSAIYSAIFICGWNYSFPTPAEQTLWRVSTVAVFCCVPLFWAVGSFAFSFWPSIASSHKSSSTMESGAIMVPTSAHSSFWLSVKSRASRIANRIRNNSRERDPELTVPLKAILPIYVLGVVYCHARAYIFLEDFIELRSLPASAYATVDWTNIFPHF